MDKLGYDFRKTMNFDSSLPLRVGSLDKCIQHFWEYRGVIYSKGSITDELFTLYGFSNERTILNALDYICMNPNLLCPLSYYKLVCLMADRKSDEIRNKAYETLVICKSEMTKCVTVECIQLLRRIIISCGRPNVKEHAVTILCEISHSNSNLITFDIYDMLRSYKMKTSDMSLSHAIEMTFQKIRQHCVHLHTQIDEYEKSLLTTCCNNCDVESDCCDNKNNEVEGLVYVSPQSYNLESMLLNDTSGDESIFENDGNSRSTNYVSLSIDDNTRSNSNYLVVNSSACSSLSSENEYSCESDVVDHSSRFSSHLSDIDSSNISISDSSSEMNSDDNSHSDD
jgi:hypothetical protein